MILFEYYTFNETYNTNYYTILKLEEIITILNNSNLCNNNLIQYSVYVL